MCKIATTILATAIFSTALSCHAFADDAKSVQRNRYEPFTGKVMREKVRVRLQPSIDSPIIMELGRNDLVVVTDEVDDFYVVQAPSSVKGYVYRPYILDGVVEGDRVNVRLAPHLEAPVIVQLNSGEKVEGKLSSQNNKWLEITPPQRTRFYVASDYVEKVGDSNYLTKQETRLNEANTILNNTFFLAQSELQLPFPEIDLEKILSNYRTIINDYKDFPEQVTRAKESISKFQDEYLHKKIAYLEAKAKAGDQEREALLKSTTAKLARENPNAQKTAQNTSQPMNQYEGWLRNQQAYEVSAKMLAWSNAELALYESWAASHEHRSIQDFYEDQKKQAVTLQGILEPYDRPVRNKPGDFLLVNRANRLPIAFLYSTQVNLQDKIGQEVRLEGVLRPNKNFAYPAYFVLSTQ